MGQLRDGTPIEGKDCVIIKSKRLRKSVAESEVSVPESYALAQNYPNPFNPETWMPFQLSYCVPSVPIHGKVSFNVKSKDDVVIAALNISNKSIVPIFSISSVTGVGVDHLQLFLQLLPAKRIEEADQELEFRVKPVNPKMVVFRYFSWPAKS